MTNTTHFGYKTVAEEEKVKEVAKVFHSVAAKYDVMNDLMSAGLHRLWKDAMVAWLNPPKRAGWRLLDVAGGTGDIALRVVEAARVVLAGDSRWQLRRGATRAIVVIYEDSTVVQGCAVTARWECAVPRQD